MAIKSKPELINIESLEQNYLKRNIRKTFSTPHQWQALPDMWHWLARKYSNKTAIKDPHHNNVEYTFSELAVNIDKFASGLQYLRLKHDDKVCIFAENSARWLIVDQGIMKTGAVNAVRSSSAPVEELIYILKHSESKGLIVENIELYNKLKNHLSLLQLDFVIVLFGKIQTDEKKIFSFNQVLQLGSKNVFRPVNIEKNDPATIIYTSGTTGKPKGAVLTHGNLLHQVHKFALFVRAKSTDTALSILPIWHAYERTCDYFLYSRGSCVVYTNLRNFKQDLQKYKPTYLVLVPRILDSIYEGISQEISKQSKFKQFIFKIAVKTGKMFILSLRTFTSLNLNEYNPSFINKIRSFVSLILLLPLFKLFNQVIYKKIRNAFGGNIKCIISGGGALSPNLEDFYETVGVNILVGYGLTETSPVLTVRNPERNLRGSVGQPLEFTQIKIVNPESGKTLPSFNKGLVMVRGPQIMQGYYNDIQATNNAIDREGWFNTGDLGWLTDKNDLVLTGRLKDLIVLSNGEKVEPVPIEETCLNSSYIKQIMLTGQDQRSLFALIVPDIDNLRNIAEFNNINKNNMNEKRIIDFYLKEVNNLIKNRQNYRSFEQIANLRIISEEFSIDNGLLTQTLKIKRSSVVERFKDLINEMTI